MAPPKALAMMAMAVTIAVGPLHALAAKSSSSGSGSGGGGGGSGSGAGSSSGSSSGSCSVTEGIQITFYGGPDNDPPFTSKIADKSCGRELAGGSGTYSDPLTFASAPGEYKQCELLYFPYLKKYIRMDDECVQCETDWKSKTKHIDIWAGANEEKADGFVDCQNGLSRSSEVVVHNPPADLEVIAAPLWANGACSKSAFPGASGQCSGGGSGSNSSASASASGGGGGSIGGGSGGNSTAKVDAVAGGDGAGGDGAGGDGAGGDGAGGDGAGGDGAGGDGAGGDGANGDGADGAGGDGAGDMRRKARKQR